jgi:hypothetical protein
MALFDFADASVVTGERATTTVPTQALYLMNNPVVVKLSEEAAGRLMKVGEKERLKAAYVAFLGRGRRIARRGRPRRSWRTTRRSWRRTACRRRGARRRRGRRCARRCTAARSSSTGTESVNHGGTGQG